jgi:hypothetical protein
MRKNITTLALTALLAVAAASIGVGTGVGSLAAGQETTTTSTPTDASDLDLREANVVNVTVERSEDGPRTFDFSVTLYHDDDGEPGYANWWQVETLNGTELGRRDLLHAHSTRPFTRSERIEVPENVSLVVVRGHDQTHGYGGQAMVVDLRTGATEAVRQGPERREFGECAVVAPENGTATTTTAATASSNQTATSAETDLVRCPWEERDDATTTG